MRVRSKSEYIALAERFTFGNRLREWASPAAFKTDSYNGLVTVRHRRGGLCKYNVPAGDVDTVVGDWAKQGADESMIWLNESAPDERLTAQGEAMRSAAGWTLFVSTEKAKMRDALRRSGVHIEGLRALSWLQHYFSPSSFADFEALVELYPDSVIEFSAYEHCLGFFPMRNVLIWEVRNY